MKSFFRILFVVLAICLVAIGARFAADNAQPVSLAWGNWMSPEAPLFAWLILCILGSFLAVWLVFSLTLIRQRARIRRLETRLNRSVTPSGSSSE